MDGGVVWEEAPAQPPTRLGPGDRDFPGEGRAQFP